MLPTHVFADAVGFLYIYDLDALMLTDSCCSEIAHMAASKIRIFDFSEFEFIVYDSEVDVYKLEEDEWVAVLESVTRRT
ncbi:hypothetical protein AAVH_25116 [Aphelenchoides avenae]|nr:hypothetical protein AAVH_25116 [Aphelenchus avenae]